MNEDFLIIDIDRIVLIEAADYSSDQLRSQVEAGVHRVLTRTEMPKRFATRDIVTAVASEVARSVVHTVRRGER